MYRSSCRRLSQLSNFTRISHILKTNTVERTRVNVITNCFIAKSKHTIMPEPGVKEQWDLRLYEPATFSDKVEELISQTRTTYDKIASVPDDQVNYVNVIKALSDVECEFSTKSAPLEFSQRVAIDDAIRDASTEASRTLQAFEVEMSMRKEIFDKVECFRLTKEFDALEPEGKRFVERLIKIGKRNGLHLGADVREEIKNIKKRMSELSITFMRNLDEEKQTLEFTDDDLEGLPEDFLQSLEKLPSGKYSVTLKYPHYFPIARKARKEDTRLRIDTAFLSRCKDENAPILEELIELRQKQADLLGYPTHAAYVTEMRMSKNPETVKSFLDELAEKLQPLWQKEKDVMLQFKKEECEAANVPFSGSLNYSDCRYYMSMVEEKLYGVDQNVLKEYFPLHTVTKGLLEIYQLLLGVKFTEIEKAEVWHPDVQMFKIDDTETDDLMGYFFLDLFPRKGKYGHAGVCPLQQGCLTQDGTRQVPVAAMMTNFTKPTEERPSLLDHKEVETFFHEFGHVMHHMCAKVRYPIFCGTRVERDFVEAPSQMLENWVWEKIPLQKMSAHYKDGRLLPDDLIENLVKSQQANAGIFNLRQVALATFDQRIHSTSKVDTAKFFSQVYGEITGTSCIPGTNMSASFQHLVGGYDADYYGYLWSEVFSMDMFYSRFKKEDIMSPTVGRDYRRCILEPGGSLDAVDMLRNFLHREPKTDAFLNSKGLQPN